MLTNDKKNKTRNHIIKKVTTLALAFILTQQQFLTALTLAEEPDLSIGYAYDEGYAPVDPVFPPEGEPDLPADVMTEGKDETGDLYLDDPLWQEDEYPAVDDYPQQEEPLIIIDEPSDHSEENITIEEEDPSAQDHKPEDKKEGKDPSSEEADAFSDEVDLADEDVLDLDGYVMAAGTLEEIPFWTRTGLPLL